jgi:predicted esterase
VRRAACGAYTANVHDSPDPHAHQTVLRLGPAPEDARLTIICVHGRNAGAENILDLAAGLGAHDVAFLAPNAAGRTWYPYSFLAPMEQNQPGLDSGLRVLARLVEALTASGIASERIGLMGFSQGACLALEFVARHAQRHACVAGLSGGLIGPPGTPRNYTGTLAGTPVLLGCSDIDAHIPLERVHETTRVLRSLGAVVDERIYPGMGHTVNDDELEAVRALLTPAAPYERSGAFRD